ncbi:hypothetical protein OKA04_06790 [Luteolibacter flavescens]|uniref:PepSY domain-containing protein n=1 Tax=Luteolibacter flavescens TaxID=1859460 RepID=A0ABT3FLI6_9BACT|nr:hypothetical protein [Luteolibacter flavescens]MCW1884432.1 hypothetical protein [Luteolibacter flavescens]
MRAPTTSPSLPRTWFLHSRTFWLGLLVTSFFIWLTVDSHVNTSVIRTIHRGSWRDWSATSTIPAGTPAESGSLMLELAGGAIGIRWLDELMRDASYSGNDERGKADPKFRKIWLPKIVNDRDSVMRIRGAYLPTWVLLAAWLGLWAWQLLKSGKRLRIHPASGLTPAS